MSSYSCAEKQMTLTSSCSYRGTHAWAATHVQKKWHSWAATHVQKKWHSWATAQRKGYSCTWAAAHVQEKTVMSSCSCGAGTFSRAPGRCLRWSPTGTRAWAAAHECKMNFIMHEQNLRGGNPRLRGGNTRLRGGFTRSWFLGIMGVKKNVATKKEH